MIKTVLGRCILNGQIRFDFIKGLSQVRITPGRWNPKHFATFVQSFLIRVHQTDDIYPASFRQMGPPDMTESSNADEKHTHTIHKIDSSR